MGKTGKRGEAAPRGAPAPPLRVHHEQPGATVWCGDGIALMKEMPDNVMDVVFLDPPYNVGFDYGDGRDKDRLSPAAYARWMRRLLTAASRVARLHVILFPGLQNDDEVPKWIKGTGLRIIQPKLGWHRREFAGDVYPEGRPAICWEPVRWLSALAAPKCNRVFGHSGRNFLAISSARPEAVRGHPCPKPLEVMRWLVQMFVPEGGSAFDPMCGSGTMLVAARETGRRAYGCDDKPVFCDLTVDRLRQSMIPLLPAPDPQTAMFTDGAACG